MSGITSIKSKSGLISLASQLNSSSVELNGEIQGLIDSLSSVSNYEDIDVESAAKALMTSLTNISNVFAVIAANVNGYVNEIVEFDKYDLDIDNSLSVNDSVGDSIIPGVNVDGEESLNANFSDDDSKEDGTDNVEFKPNVDSNDKDIVNDNSEEDTNTNTGVDDNSDIGNDASSNPNVESDNNDTVIDKAEQEKETNTGVDDNNNNNSYVDNNTQFNPSVESNNNDAVIGNNNELSGDNIQYYDKGNVLDSSDDILYDTDMMDEDLNIDDGDIYYPKEENNYVSNDNSMNDFNDLSNGSNLASSVLTGLGVAGAVGAGAAVVGTTVKRMKSNQSIDDDEK